MTAARELSDDECDAIERPVADAFGTCDSDEQAHQVARDVIRAAYAAGRESMRKDAVEACWAADGFNYDDPGETFASIIKVLP